MSEPAPYDVPWSDPTIRAAWQQYQATNLICHAQYHGDLIDPNQCRTCHRTIGKRGRPDCPGDCRQQWLTYDRDRQHARYQHRKTAAA